MKYVGLPVKVLPEAVFEATLEDSRRRMQAWGAAQGPEAKRRLEEGQSELATAREAVEVARAAWLAVPDGEGGSGRPRRPTSRPCGGRTKPPAASPT